MPPKRKHNHYTKSKDKEDQREVRKRDRQIRKKHRNQQKKNAFKLSAEYVAFFKSFDKQLKEVALQLKDVGGDGNCLFRSVADQVDGDEQLHQIYRDSACRHMRQNSDFYAMFIDEDEDGTIENYIGEMSKDGEWGGNQQLQALSSCMNMNIVVHRIHLEQTIIEPMLSLSNSKRFTIHLAYFQQQNFEHYTSVRMFGDDSKDPGMGPLQKIPQYMALNFNYIMNQRQQTTEEQQLIRLQMQQLGMEGEGDDGEVKKPKQIQQPYPNYPRNKKCKCGSKQTYKNCCYKQYQKVKSMMLENIYN